MSTATLTPTATIYRIDPAHSNAHFSVRHMMIANVRGEFTKVTGTIVYDPANLGNSKVDVEIEASSINTRESQRDTHLKSPDFLDVEKFPTLAFHSKEVRQTDAGLEVQGDLTVRGVVREVVLHVEDFAPESKDPWGNTRMGATATTKINRKDFGLTWNAALEAGGVLVGDEVKITLDVEAVKQA